MPKNEFKIAKRLYFSQEGEERHSRPAIRVALAGIIVGVMVMIVTICIVVGFKQTVTQKDVHIHNMTNFIELMEAEGLRDKMICCCGGARITHELAKELGFDAGFGMNTYADDVASFVVQEMVKRGMK